MATAGGVELNEVLQFSPGKVNFMKVKNLLFSAGDNVVRRLFDSKIPPRDLANKLSDPAVETTLRRLKNRLRVLTNPEWEKLYPPNSTVVKSKSFDLTLLVKLLRNICGLTAPVNGWDNLPSSSDTSLEAALATIRWYRNEYSHANSEGMKISDDDFDDHWNDIKDAILRIVSHIDSSSVAKCEKDIDKNRTAPLSPVDMDRLRDNLGCSEILLLCTPRWVSTGAKWVQGSAFILANYVKDIVNYFDPTRGVEIVDVTEGSIKLVLWVTDLDALERFWRSYKTGELKKELKRILITEELKRLAHGDDVELEVSVSEEEYKKAHEQLKAKEEEALAQEMEAKVRIGEETSPFEIFDGDIIEDGENKFQAHFAVITSKDQVKQVLAELKEKESDVAEATRYIWAYRIFDADEDDFDEECNYDIDDDSGEKVLYLLKGTRAQNLIVVVACRYETSARGTASKRLFYICKSVLDLLLIHGVIKLERKVKKFLKETEYTPFYKEPATTEDPAKPTSFDIISGEPVSDRNSTFQGHLADITSREQVDQVLAELKKDRKIAKAKYNMWACRIYDEKKKSYLEDGNDDGENQGAERLLHLLIRSDAKNVVVIVTRWHGGIHLGTDRFKHINKCASDLLQQRGRPAAQASTTSDPKETRKKSSKKHK